MINSTITGAAGVDTAIEVELHPIVQNTAWNWVSLTVAIMVVRGCNTAEPLVFKCVATTFNLLSTWPCPTIGNSMRTSSLSSCMRVCGGGVCLPVTIPPITAIHESVWRWGMSSSHHSTNHCYSEALDVAKACVLYWLEHFTTHKIRCRLKSMFGVHKVRRCVYTSSLKTLMYMYAHHTMEAVL